MRSPPTPGRHAFAFRNGEWRVRHRKLEHPLTGSTDWVEFDGTCRAWELLGGEASVDDHVLGDPCGAYQAAAFRRTDPRTGMWSIWWIDPRLPALEPPAHGGFEGSVGAFHADRRLKGRPIKMRSVWSNITPTAALWEQAFSDDAGQTWETNWTMTFARTT